MKQRGIVAACDSKRVKYNHGVVWASNQDPVNKWKITQSKTI